MNLMAQARVLSLEQDSPYLWFVCRRWMEFLVMTLSSATLSWVWVLFRPLSFPIPKPHVRLARTNLLSMATNRNYMYECQSSQINPRRENKYVLGLTTASLAVSLIPFLRLVWQTLKVSTASISSLAVDAPQRPRFIYRKRTVSCSFSLRVFPARFINPRNQRDKKQSTSIEIPLCEMVKTNLIY